MTRFVRLIPLTWGPEGFGLRLNYIGCFAASSTPRPPVPFNQGVPTPAPKPVDGGVPTAQPTLPDGGTPTPAPPSFPTLEPSESLKRSDLPGSLLLNLSKLITNQGKLVSVRKEGRILLTPPPPLFQELSVQLFFLHSIISLSKDATSLSLSSLAHLPEHHPPLLYIMTYVTLDYPPLLYIRSFLTFDYRPLLYIRSFLTFDYRSLLYIIVFVTLDYSPLLYIITFLTLDYLPQVIHKNIRGI